jgi:hypothetical protein
MAIYLHPDILDGGLLALQSNASKLALVKTYTLGDSYATVMGNRIAEVTLASSDYTLSAGSAANSRKIVNAAKSASATAAGTTGDYHFVFHDGSARILRVVNETSEAAISVGQTVNFPALPLYQNQPTES